MDVHMANMDGLQATRLAKAGLPQVKVVVLTLYGEYEAEAMAAAVDAFVDRSEAADRLLATLSSVTASRRPILKDSSGGVSWRAAGKPGTGHPHQVRDRMCEAEKTRRTRRPRNAHSHCAWLVALVAAPRDGHFLAAIM